MTAFIKVLLTSRAKQKQLAWINSFYFFTELIDGVI